MKDGDSRHSDEVAVFSFLEPGLRSSGLAPSREQVSQLTELVLLLSEWSRQINLTAHRTPLEIAGRLVLDAASLGATLPELEAAETIVDLGSGPGFPGLPLAILYPHLEVTLVESRKKRVHFQREVRRKLGLNQVTPLLGRSDDLAPRPADISVAQAMAQPDSALTLMIPWTKPGGLLALPGSETSPGPSETEAIERVECRPYAVPETGLHRRLWVTRRRAT